MAVVQDTTDRDAILTAIRQAGESQTARELGQKPEKLMRLVRDGFLRTDGTKKAGRGRPGNAFKLAEKGRKRAAALAKKNQ